MRVGASVNQLMNLQGVLKNHQIYKNINSEKNLKIFMESFVFGVWDFMLLLKELQRRLTCVDKIWRPSLSANSARFINEIVMVEETDIHPNGKDYISHFELYLNAMRDVGANTKPILNFVHNVSAGKSIESELRNKSIPLGVADFVMNTVNVLNKPTPYVASQFFYGRENPVPEVFGQFLSNLGNDKKFDMLKYYFQRHIEVDGDEHGPMAEKLMNELAAREDPEFCLINESSINAIEHVIKLLDSIEARFEK